MLKALELVGFKSFADKTRFEFPAGITVVVGPNGSGKSNIVDAIKWVLGEQSVKSLRGKEMADVIFNGSGGRRAVNSAEATLTFDNAAGLLSVDTPEVHITRRVYRSGEGEYLINRQPCRLRDIRDLFAGTGAATEAYSVIEQGKVDVLLQASPRDRRVIFEEAAGISRFKAKKLEAARRLERVDQNLLRLSDIVDEVDSRLRSVRMQASKARRYKEHTDRLQELRTQVGLADWRTLTDKLEAIESDLARLRDEIAESSTEIESHEARSLELERAIAEADELIRACESDVADNRERIASRESTIEHERRRCRDLEEEIKRVRLHLAGMNSRAGTLEQDRRTTSEALGKAENQYEGVRRQLTDDEQALASVTTQLAKLRDENEKQRSEHMDHMRSSASLGNQISGLESQIAAARRSAAKHQSEIDELEALRQTVAKELDKLRADLKEQEETAASCDAHLKASQQELSASRQEFSAQQKELAQLQGRHTGAVERATVLEELEKRLEGLSAGVKQVLLEARENADGPFHKVRGLVADLLHVSVESAPLIEVALGALAQCLVVAPDRQLIKYLEKESSRLEGRVGFLRMDATPPSTAADRVNLEGQPGVLGRADQFVETTPEFVTLTRRLLGHTWVVEDLATALTLSESTGRGLNFVTLAGELVSAEGTLSVGPRQSTTGLISRRSELRALRTVISELDERIRSTEASVTRLDRQVRQQEQEVQTAAADHQQAAAALAEHRLRTDSSSQRLAELDKRLQTLHAELEAAKSQGQQATDQLTSARDKLQQTDACISKLQTAIEAAAEELTELEQRRSRLNQEVTRQQIELAKSEQQLDSLRRQMQRLEYEGQERDRAVQENQKQLDLCHGRIQQAQRSILQAGSEVAELYLCKEQLAAQAVAAIETREQHRNQRAQIADQVQQVRRQLRKLEEKTHTLDLSAGELRHQRATLAQRLREDYEIELAELEHEPTDEELHEREAVEQEIAELRRKINNIGNVNLEALGELEELEARHGSLSAQFDDLSKAKASLEQIIGRINADSRKLFSETLDVVRDHFQTLFRKLFGGGQADIILDEGEDILESGIEIVARPPGKEPRSISLLSGGEKTLTCVALLMAIFRSRPSPFCVLDEVDAALDEANIERFVTVVREFLQWTQFIIVTHSKKTMTCASTLYGVTMQESGVSKRVSVRFEDVSEDGHIHESAFENTEQDQAAAAEDDETQAA